MSTLRPLYSFFRHGITQAASLVVYHYSGPYISYTTRLAYEQYYEWAYGTPEWWSLENMIYYLPQREYWTYQGFQYGESYGPIICATLAAWLVHHAQKKLYGTFSQALETPAPVNTPQYQAYIARQSQTNTEALQTLPRLRSAES
jgi:hypothetical protein